jgi:hypothetical protein
MLLLSSFRVHNFNSHKVTSQLSVEVSFEWVEFKLLFLMYIFNCLIMALPKAKTCSKQ